MHLKNVDVEPKYHLVSNITTISFYLDPLIILAEGPFYNIANSGQCY